MGINFRLDQLLGGLSVVCAHLLKKGKWLIWPYFKYWFIYESSFSLERHRSRNFWSSSREFYRDLD